METIQEQIEAQVQAQATIDILANLIIQTKIKKIQIIIQFHKNPLRKQKQNKLKHLKQYKQYNLRTQSNIFPEVANPTI
jgi:hypothetical protein